MKQLVPAESPSFNAGWEAYFIQRELSDNPNEPGTDYYDEWLAGFESAKSSAGK